MKNRFDNNSVNISIIQNISYIVVSICRLSLTLDLLPLNFSVGQSRVSSGRKP